MTYKKMIEQIEELIKDSNSVPTRAIKEILKKK